MITFGSNNEGQLGRGHTRSTRAIGTVKGMQVQFTIGLLIQSKECKYSLLQGYWYSQRNAGTVNYRAICSVKGMQVQFTIGLLVQSKECRYSLLQGYLFSQRNAGTVYYRAIGTVKGMQVQLTIGLFVQSKGCIVEFTKAISTAMGMYSVW